MNDEIEALIDNIDEDADKAHADITPSVTALGEIGLPAAPRVIDLLDAPDEMTRLHAQRALEAIINRGAGFRYGQGFPAGAEERVRELWRANGDYAYDAPPPRRAAAIAMWREWVRSQ
jgi:hypothetical protein